MLKDVDGPNINWMSHTKIESTFESRKIEIVKKRLCEDQVTKIKVMTNFVIFGSFWFK